MIWIKKLGVLRKVPEGGGNISFDALHDFSEHCVGLGGTYIPKCLNSPCIQIVGLLLV